MSYGPFEILETRVGFAPTYSVLQTDASLLGHRVMVAVEGFEPPTDDGHEPSALPLSYTARIWRDRRDSHPLSPA